MILAKWALIILLVILGAWRALSQTIMPSLGVDPGDTNAYVMLRSATLMWNSASNATSYVWGVTNAGTNMSGNTTLTNVQIYIALGTNLIQVRSVNSTTNSPWTYRTYFIFATNTVTLWPQPEHRDLLANGTYSPWSAITNQLPWSFYPTGLGRQYRCKLTSTNWWELQ